MTREQAINYLKSSGMSEEQIETVINALTCKDCISREAVHDLIATWLSDYLLDETREILEVIDEKVEDLPSVTPKAELWNKLYLWLNDMHLGISPDEFTPDDERKCRTAQTDIIEDVMGWIEANAFEPQESEG